LRLKFGARYQVIYRPIVQLVFTKPDAWRQSGLLPI